MGTLALILVVTATAVLLTRLTGAGGSSGDTKTTCLYTRDDVQQLQQMQSKLGRPLNCAIVFNDAAQTWTQWTSAWFLHAPSSKPQYQWPAWGQADSSRFLVVTQSLIPKEVPADWRVRGANGEYDSYFRALGADLVAQGFGDSIIRLGHEANGTWYSDNIGKTAADHQAWRDYWAHASSALKSVPGSHFELDWTVAAGVGSTPFGDYYPGNGAVDIIGADIYDSTTTGGRRQPARWQHELAGGNGASALFDFAAAHSKPISIPEWGLITAAKPDGAGDDPYFVDRIADLVRQRTVRYQGYFETQPASGIFGTSPQSLAAWIARYGTKGDARGS